MLPFAKSAEKNGETATDCGNLSSLSQLSSLLSTEPELTTHANPWLLVYSPSSPNLYIEGVDSPLHIVMLPIPQINSELIYLAFFSKCLFVKFSSQGLVNSIQMTTCLDIDQITPSGRDPTPVTVAISAGKGRPSLEEPSSSSRSNSTFQSPACSSTDANFGAWSTECS